MRYSLRELIFWCSTSYASWKFFTDLSAAVSGMLLVGTSCREGGKGPGMVVERLWKGRGSRYGDREVMEGEGIQVWW